MHASLRIRQLREVLPVLAAVDAVVIDGALIASDAPLQGIPGD